MSVGFYMVTPEEFRIARQHFTAGAVHVWMVLRLRANDEGHAWPSQGRMVLDTGMPERSVRDALDQLKKAGWIEKVGTVSRAIKYQLYPPETEDSTRQKTTGFEDRKRQASAGYAPSTRQPSAGLDERKRQGVAGFGTEKPAETCKPPIQKNSNSNSTPTLPANCGQSEGARCEPPAGVGVEPLRGEGKPKDEVTRLAQHLVNQPWWLRKLSHDPLRKAQVTRQLLGDYAARQRIETVWTWLELAMHTGSELRVLNPGAWIYTHLRGYGTNRWKPERQKGGVRQMHRAVLAGDIEEALKALRLENGYASEEKAMRIKAELTAGMDALAADLAGDEVFEEAFHRDEIPAPVRPVAPDAAEKARVVNETASLLSDIEGWLLDQVPGRDIEDARERLALTQGLAAQLMARCDPRIPARCLVDLFLFEAEGMEARGLTPAWAWSVLAGVAEGGPMAIENGMPAPFYERIWNGDCEGAAKALSATELKKAEEAHA